MSEAALDSFTRETFHDRLGEAFGIRSDQLPGPSLELVEVNELGGQSDSRDPFSLIFLGPMEPVLPQAIYPLIHEVLGTIELFLVPVGPNKDQTGLQYEAIFS